MKTRFSETCEAAIFFSAFGIKRDLAQNYCGGNGSKSYRHSLRDRPKPPERAMRTVSVSADVTVLLVMV